MKRLLATLLLGTLAVVAFAQPPGAAPETPEQRISKLEAAVRKQAELIAERDAKLQAMQKGAQPMPGGPGVPVVPPAPSRARGYKLPPPDVLKARHAAAAARHGNRVAALPAATPPKFDCRELGWVGKIKNQADCGSCYVFGAIAAAESAFLKAGYAKADDFSLSEQYFLDCKNVGGCNGGWGSEVIDFILREGVPATADYAPYEARSRQCRLKPNAKLWKIADRGYCTPNQEQGIAKTQDIKNCLVAYGTICVAVDSRGYDNYNGGVISGAGDNIDHQVDIVGWDDAKGRNGAWLVRNSWSTDWGVYGYGWQEYGSYSIGTEAEWVAATPLPPPTCPPGQHLDPATGKCVPDVPPPPVGGNIVITVPAGTAPGSYTVGTEAALSAADADALRAVQDVIARLLKPSPTPVDPEPPAAWMESAQVSDIVIEAVRKSGNAEALAKITKRPLLRKMVMDSVYRKMARDPEGQRLLADAAINPDNVIKILDWIMKNILPLILQIIGGL